MWSPDNDNPLGKASSPFEYERVGTPTTDGSGIDEFGDSRSGRANRGNHKDTRKTHPLEAGRKKQNLRSLPGLGNGLAYGGYPSANTQAFPSISAAVRRRVKAKTSKEVDDLFNEFLYNLRNDDSTFESVASRLADDLTRLHDRLDNAA